MWTELIVVAAFAVLVAAVVWAVWWVEKEDRAYGKAAKSLPVVVVKEEDLEKLKEARGQKE